MWVHNVLTREECRAIELQSLPFHTPQGGKLAPGERSQFSCQDPELSQMMWSRVREVFPPQIDGGEAVGLKREIAHARYGEGQVGFPHMDFRHSGGSWKDPSIASRFSFTVSLHLQIMCLNTYGTVYTFFFSLSRLCY